MREGEKEGMGEGGGGGDGRQGGKIGKWEEGEVKV